jgi:tellurite resistance protein
MSNSNHLVLLQIAQLIALSDGSISSAEEAMILELPQRLGLDTTGIASKQHNLDLASLGRSLKEHGDRCLAARIACLVAGVSRNPGDQSDINADERASYRQLTNTLNLSEEELAEIEWSAKDELKKGKTLLQLLGDALFGAGSWPDPSLMGPEIPGL